MNQIHRGRQSGFTLVEIAIVLVIIGLLLGGVLRGQEMIENARVKSIVNDMRAIQSAYTAFLDRFKAIPGDETAATMNARGWTGVAGGNGNGVLAITLADTFANGAVESTSFWRAVRGAGLIAGDPNAAAGVASLPRHGGGGLIGVTSGTVFGLAGTFVCASGLSTRVAAAVDVLIDGPLPANQIGSNVGDLRGITGAANPLAPTAAAAATAYNEATVNTPWTVCMRIA